MAAPISHVGLLKFASNKMLFLLILVLTATVTVSQDDPTSAEQEEQPLPDVSGEDPFPSMSGEDPFLGEGEASAEEMVAPPPPQGPKPRLPEIASEDIDPLIKQHSSALIMIGTASCGDECTKASEILMEIVHDIEVEDFVAAYVTDNSLHANMALKTDVNYLVLLYRKNTTPIYINPHFQMSAGDIFSTIEDVARHEPSVKTLHDDSFEHETQAATGATTGDWLVVFHEDQCLTPRMKSIIETLATKFSHEYVNTALVDTKANTRLKKRFQVKMCPEIYLFKKGKQYLFPSASRVKVYENLEAFPKNTFKYAKNSAVAVEPTPFDELTSKIVLKLKELTSESSSAVIALVFSVSAAVLSLVLLVCCYCCCKSKGESGLPHNKND